VATIDASRAPVFGPDFMSGEESVFPGQADWPDGVLDRVGVELETSVFEEARQPLPMIERIADILGERRPAGDHRQLLLEPRLQRGDHGQRVVLARCQAAALSALKCFGGALENSVIFVHRPGTSAPFR